MIEKTFQKPFKNLSLGHPNLSPGQEKLSVMLAGANALKHGWRV